MDRNPRSFVVLIRDEMDFRLKLYFDEAGAVLEVLSLNRLGIQEMELSLRPHEEIEVLMDEVVELFLLW